MELLEDVGLMAARVALSSNGRNGQYVGTSRVTPPTATAGSPTARLFNGLSDRIVVFRSGRIAGQLSRAEATETRIMEYAFSHN